MPHPALSRLAVLAAVALAGLATAPAASAQWWHAHDFRAKDAQLPVDGYYGPATEAAVRRYQALHGAPPTGVADLELLWSLGVHAHHPLRRGMSGAEVRALQRALQVHARIWSGPPKRIPRPKLQPGGPTPSPAPMFTPPPAPWPTPSPAPVVELPAPAPVPHAPAGRAMLEAWGGAWVAPIVGGGTGPVVFGGGALWLGDFGLAGEYTQGPDLGAGVATDLIDGQLRWRGPWSIGHLALGYRSAGGESLGMGGLGLDLPLGVDWLRLRAQGLGGSNFGSGWMADGRGGLALLLGPVTLEGGARAVMADGLTGMTGQGTAYGTAFSAGLRF